MTKQVHQSIFSFFLLASILLVSSCKEEENGPTRFSEQTILKNLEVIESFSMLTAALKKTGLSATLDDPRGKYTIFAPNNAAFIEAGFADVAAIEAANTADLEVILKRHVLDSVRFSRTLNRPNERLITIGGDNLTVTQGGSGQILINGITLSPLDQPAINGVYHTVSKIITLPETVAVAVANTADFSILEAALRKTNLFDALDVPTGTFTLFAPTNEAFAAAGFADEAAVEAADVTQLTEILQNHVIAGRKTAASITEGEVVKTLNNRDVVFTKVNNQIFINGRQIIQADRNTTNGIIHTVNEVVPFTKTTAEKTISEFVADEPSFSLLEAALKRADVFDALNAANGTFTVFAPTNEAFVTAGFANEAAINAADANTLKGILEYHVLSTKQKATDLPAGPNGRLKTLDNAREIFITKNGNNVSVNGVAVTSADLEVANGVIHTLGAVLTPIAAASANVITTIRNNPDFDIFERAIDLLNANPGSNKFLKDLLTETGPFTAFVPTNQAMISFFDATVNGGNGNGTVEDGELLDPPGFSSSDPDNLRQYIEYAFIPNKLLLFNDLVNGTQPTIQGDPINVVISGNQKKVGSSPTTPPSVITSSNILATNGIIHVVDTVVQ